MHATITSTTSCIATIGGAGRRQKHIAQIAQDTVTGMPPVASQSLVQKPPGQWTARISARIAKKISFISSKKKVQPAGSGTENEYTKKQLRDAARLIAYRHQKARLELIEASEVAAIYASEDFDKLFPPSLRYLRVTWEEEYNERSAVLAWQ